MKDNNTSIYRRVWRWHFYAGVIFAPILIMLAITGGIYLFKPEIQNILYKDLYQVEQKGAPISATEQIAIVEKEYPDAKISRFRKGETKERSTEIEVLKTAGSYIVYVNPYNGDILGELKKDEMFMEWVVKLHGELMIGTIGDRIVELAACWAIILLITGLYLWFPRDGKLYGIFKIRFKQGKRIFYRDTHVMLGTWLSLFILLLVLTGLPWAGFLGDKINQVATSTHTGYPMQLWDEVPQSSVPTKEVADVPWAAESMPVPKSYNLNSLPSLPVENIIQIAEEKNVHPGFSINFPEGETGVYTISVFPQKPKDQATLHINQYTGGVLADLRFADYGPMAKVIEIGIALHEGRYFGLLNQLFGLLTCLGLVLIVWSGVVMWWKRRPAGKLGAPTKLKSDKMSRKVLALTILLGILLPLAGISIIFVLLIDYFLIRRIPAAKEYFSA
ncbi:MULTISPECIES: PepSY domain-containing protein [unclassified Bacillus (in: firmicutes)]|uniref:PepSY-associated TM helix domain-containing protein n=1 Tax=unclassified Bacillus (in: firmicutes) TaxID=185979 RepID=UPI0008E233DB|nr:MULTISPECIES: PepSY domain-containing protein [unclassified Bacillus (in: firmicutes)]SFB06813.1 Uncharacterized iron-regulated membrane protein [Bacillus sp. UNCCL13]SFQ87565.1 Uncharacterized iron-regulated membrane protein [Bacillus sp. cl95]